MEQIYFVTWQSNQAVKSTSTRLLIFRALCGKDARIPCNHGKVKRTTWIFPELHASSRITGNRRRAIWVQVVNFPRTHFSGTAARESDENDKTRNQTRRIRRMDHLHVDVQWHRLVKGYRYFQCFFELFEYQRLRRQISGRDIGLFSVLVMKKNGMERTSTPTRRKVEEHRWCDADQFRRKRKSSFPSIQCVRSRILEKNGGHFPIHFSGDTSNAKLLFRTIRSIDRLSMYGAVADWCEVLAQQIPA